MMPPEAGNGLQTTAAQSTALAETFDDLIADAGRGRENIDAEDIRPPRMKICQSGSPERKPDNQKQIKGLEELDLFNSLTSEIYGRDVRFVVVAFLGKTYVEFNKDLEVVERDIPPTDPRTKFTLAEDGKTSIKPVATTFYNFLLWLVDKQDMVLFSFKSTGIGVARQLLNLMNSPLKVDGKIVTMQPPPWARVYHLQTKMINDGTYSYGAFNLSHDGITPAELRKQISALAKNIEGKRIVVDVDDAPEEAGASEGAEPQASSGAGDPSDM